MSLVTLRNSSTQSYDGLLAHQLLSDPTWFGRQCGQPLPEIFGTAAAALSSPEFRIRAGSLLVTGRGDPPPWLHAAVEALGTILDLPENWDSYGAACVDPEAVRHTVYLLSEIMRAETPLPSVVPTNTGGIQLEWHVNGVDLEIEIVSRYRVAAWFRDLRTEQEWEEDVVTDLGRLVRSIDRLVG